MRLKAFFVILGLINYVIPQASGCDLSSMYLKSGPTYDQTTGKYTTVVSICIGISSNWDATNNFSVEVSGGSFASISSISPISLNNNYLYCGGVCYTNGCSIGSVQVSTTATSYISGGTITYSRTSSSAYPFSPSSLQACDMPDGSQYCFDLTIITNGSPASVKINGLEDDGGSTNQGVGCPEEIILNSSNCTPPTGLSAQASPDVACIPPGGSTQVVFGNSGTGSSGTTYSSSWTMGSSSYTGKNFNTQISTAGTYSATLKVCYTNNPTCCATTTTNATLFDSPVLTSHATPVTCYMGSNGSIDASVSGGTAPYSYLWSNGQTTQDIQNIGANNYSVTVTDANGCKRTSTATVTQPQSIYILPMATNPHCSAPGSIQAEVSGGTGPNYTYLWSPSGGSGGNTTTYTGLNAGTYTLKVTDSNGCTKSKTVTLTHSNPAVSLTSTVAPPTCYNGNNGSATIQASGGTSPYNYSWPNGTSSSSQSNSLSPGSYNIPVSDIYGCQGSIALTIPFGEKVNTPQNRIVSNISSSEAKVSWTAVPNAVRYVIKLRYAGSGTVIKTAYTTNIFYKLLSLQPNTSYTWSVAAVNANDCFSYFSMSQSFQTLMSCPKPASLAVADATDSSAHLSWQSIQDTVVTGYQVNLRKSNESWPSTPIYNTSSSSLSLTGLEPGTTYNWAVRSACTPEADLKSKWTYGNAFTTSGLKVMSVNQVSKNDFFIYPNPASNLIHFDLNTDEAEILIMDQTGRVVIHQWVNADMNTIDISSLSQGLYIYRVNQNEILNTGKIEVNR